MCVPDLKCEADVDVGRLHHVILCTIVRQRLQRVGVGVYMCRFYKHLRSGPASQSSHSIVNAVAVVSCTRSTLCWRTIHMNAITAHYLPSVTD